MSPAAPKKRKPGPKARAKARALEAEAARIKSGAPSPNKPAEPIATPPPDSLVELGPPPADPLEANAWAHRATLLAMHNAAIDNRISERERRKEIRTLAASAAKLLPHARLWQAEQLIKADREELERKQRDRRAKLEAIPPPRTAADASTP